MRRRGVAFRLFVVTSLLIIVVFSLLVITAGLFFEHFYRSSKIHVLERNMKQFASQLGPEGSGSKQVSKLLGAFMNDNDASTSILNSRLERIAIEPYFFQLQVGNKTVTVRIPMEGTTTEDLPQHLLIGYRVVVDGIFMDEKDTVLHPLDIEPEGKKPEAGLVRVEGVITDLLLPMDRSNNPFYQDSLIDGARIDWITKDEKLEMRMREGYSQQTEWTDKWSGVEYAVLIQALPGEGNEERYLFAMTSLQPVGEAVGILKRYVVYMVPIIVLLAVILSSIYSRIVSRPLIALSRTAERLAELDFTEAKEISSKDEFGDLSRYMTALSRNLDATLTELTQANRQMQEDIAEKQRLEQLRKELVANISHELKTPLAIVKGFAEGLQDGVANEKRERYLSLIVKETDRMNALIMDMLELSKFEVRAVRLRLESFSINELALKVLDSFTQQLQAKQLRLRLDPAGKDDWKVMADPRRIEQVLLNLLSNAIRHADENSVITIGIRHSLSGTVTTTIENIGPPIGEEDLNRIWDQFYRAERSRDRKFGGTGLGLAIVKHILELHGSKFGAANTDEGVVFSFTLYENGGYSHE
ncbi:signal transduction histidine kinase [Paenibacillus endophyticus]|uniref:histidine kinase n=1 Tax=Paenibacillus endophyticus TaxID=1294268 RepID=A0A7W5CDG4_9BACL|nr:ATP-binding protein [Paenibacillus endophyticus]MBB3155144.1 signal transduction histidine kinase [Paenibacillus endophyticus]